MPGNNDVISVALIRFSSLGDIVLTTPVLSAIKKQFPQSRITFITKEIYGDLLEENPAIDELVLLENSFWQMAGQLRKTRFDWVIDLHANLRSYLLCFFLKKKHFVRYNKDFRLRRSMVRSGRNNRHTRHTVGKYFNTLADLDIAAPAEPQPFLAVTRQNREWGDSFLNIKRIHEKMIGIHIGARWESKQWTSSRYTELIQQVAEHYDVLLLGTTKDREELGDFNIEEGETGFIDAVGKASLGQLMALIESCAILVTADSGPMHVATGLRVPVVAMFGPTHPCLGFSPLGTNNRVICKDLECSPCSLHGEKKCRKQERACMESIEASDITGAIESIFKKKGNGEE